MAIRWDVHLLYVPTEDHVQLRYVTVILLVLILGCAGPHVSKRAEIIRTPTGFQLLSAKDQFEMSATIGGDKVDYSSKTPGLVEALIKGGAAAGASLGQAIVTKEILSDD